ncbi:MAG: hypothetical protein JXB00_03880 [Bacteroidales bacterium]|nr:hypothetical protein [Bacteroidales bacterium]
MYRFRIFYLLALLFTTLLFVACDKNDDPGNPGELLVFSSLQADKDTIFAGDYTNITAVATGYKIRFKWSKSAGDILGSGAQVVYAASKCQTGRNRITCTVNDGNNRSESKEIFIVVE